ncbi:Transaldolase [Gemmatirosa kalamazoonensis]|uniref:Transaldolase n=1 Tax=Gemmatirosa kalamazoonensis TaxID=861299 RepID=W0RH11_9BACT|nr:transaldolase [Gemmatirosa kalamazoonensis]AHG90404.1 Transaldolase [Gemmatirosa kalamazoonensis]
MSNRLQQLHAAGVSIWLDYIDRTMLFNGDLERRIRDEALTGMTSNPTIFEKAMAEGEAYDKQLSSAESGLSPWELFELVETEDVRRACDLFAPVYDATKGADGMVSIEVSPGVANDSQATVEEAKRLWRAVERPNVMIKVPGTETGAVAVRELITEGINVNITLLFSVDAHRRVIDAYLDALDARAAAGKPVDGIASVASFFVSRVDTLVDKKLDALIATLPEDRRAHAESLKGKAAIANAKMAYRLFQQKFSGPRWDALAAKGARVQRPLWASTSTKNKAYRDVMYVEQLIGPDTVNTMPPATIDAFADHGVVARTVDADLDAAERVLADLTALGIDMRQVTDQLLEEGITSFQKSFDGLLGGIEKKVSSLAAR